MVHLLWIKAIGEYIYLEGLANVYYWRDDSHPFLFQIGRMARVVFGLVLVIFG